MFNTGSITALTDTSVRNQRHWQPNALYSGYVHAIHDDGSIEVSISNKVYQALAHPAAQPGDFLSLRLLGTEPEPHFAIVGVLRHATAPEAGVHVQTSWLEAVNLLRKFDPGLRALAVLWQHYPQQLARLSAQLPTLLAGIQARTLSDEDLLKPGKLKTQVLASGSFFDVPASDAAPQDVAAPDMKALLFRLLAQLHSPQQQQQGLRQLVLEDGHAVFREQPGTAAQSLQGIKDWHIALYASEQEAGTGASTLKQLLGLNVESALLQIVNGQLAALARSDSKMSIWIMQLLLSHAGLTLPVELEFGRQLPPLTEQWQVVFSLELPRSGRIHAHIAVKKPAVAIRLQCQNAVMLDLWLERKKGLKQFLEKTGLRLEEFSVGPVEST